MAQYRAGRQKICVDCISPCSSSTKSSRRNHTQACLLHSLLLLSEAPSSSQSSLRAVLPQTLHCPTAGRSQLLPRASPGAPSAAAAPLVQCSSSSLIPILHLHSLKLHPLLLVQLLLLLIWGPTLCCPWLRHQTSLHEELLEKGNREKPRVHRNEEADFHT